MDFLINLGHMMLSGFRGVVDLLSIEMPAPYFTSEFWVDFESSFIGEWVTKLPWIQELVSWLIDFLPDWPEVSLLTIMVGYGIVVYIVFVFVKFVLDIVL